MSSFSLISRIAIKASDMKPTFLKFELLTNIRIANIIFDDIDKFISALVAAFKYVNFT